MKKVEEIYYYFLNHPVNYICSLEDFMMTIPEFILGEENGLKKLDLSLAREYYSICLKMCDDLLLKNFHNDPHNFVKNRFEAISMDFCSDPISVTHKLRYGDFDYKYRGFTFTRDCFKDSVMPIVGVNTIGDYDIGTAYYIGDNRFVTAAHCVRDLSKFKILKGSNPIILREVWFAQGQDAQKYDLAVIVVDDQIDCKRLSLADPYILENVLTIGFPQISGFDVMQVAEIVAIGAYQKAAEGQILAQEREYMSNLDCFLINARVKGGNSGSPIINDEGHVVGTLIHIPADTQAASDNPRVDLMGYGVCLPSKYIVQLTDNPEKIQLVADGEFYRLA